MNLKKYIEDKLNDDEVKSDNIILRNLITTFVALLMCITLLCTGTWAWLRDTEMVKGETMYSSVYALRITADSVGQESAPITSIRNGRGNYEYSLSANNEYIFTISAIANETTNARTGYFKLKIGNRTYYSEQIDRGETISFSLTFTNDTTIEIIECWGTSSIPEEEREILDDSDLVNMN